MADSALPVTDETDALPVGTQLGGFTIRSVLGQGGFGITYAAHNRITRKDVAIKEFFPLSMARRAGGSGLVYSQVNAETIAWALRKFEETTTTLCQLHHPNIVQVFDYVPANATGYMVMELLKGTTFRAWLDAKPGPPRIDELRRVVEPVMDALAYVHGQGLVHRDIAPDNILITDDGRPVLIDFGSVSRDLSQAQARNLSGTVGVSKRHYTAPEQMTSKSRPTPAADIYSMGAVLYRALSGSEPADGQERVEAIYLEQGPDPHRPLASLSLPGVPAATAASIDAALALRPEGRPRSVTDLRRALGGTVPVAPARDPVVAPAPPRASPPPQAAKPKAAPRGLPVLWLVIGSVVALLLAGGGALGLKAALDARAARREASSVGKVEQDRRAADQAEAERQRQAERDRQARDQAERDRQQQEQQAERDRQARAQAELDRQRQEQQAEQDRRARDQAEADRLRRQAELDRQRAEQDAERDRQARAQAELDRQRQEQDAERDRQARAQAEIERQRQAQEAERDRQARAQAEIERQRREQEARRPPPPPPPQSAGARAQNLTAILASARWATGSSANCGTPRKSYRFSTSGDSIRWQDGTGNVDVEAIVNSSGDRFSTITSQSDHGGEAGVPVGSGWTYDLSNPAQVRVSGKSSFVLVRCR